MGLMTKALLHAAKGGKKELLAYLLGGAAAGGLGYWAYRRAKDLEDKDEAEAERRRKGARENLKRQGKIVK